MTARKHNIPAIDLKALLTEDRDLMRALMEEALQQVLEAEMTPCVGAEPSERSQGRQGYRAGHDERGRVTRIGKLELRVPADRNGLFQSAHFEHYPCSEKAFVAARAETQGRSDRRKRRPYSG